MTEYGCEQKVCLIEGCGKKYSARGWCRLHYNRWWRDGTPGPTNTLIRARSSSPCSITGCTNSSCARGWCTTHYCRWKRGKDIGTAELLIQPRSSDICSIENCERKYAGKGLCLPHYQSRISHPKRRAQKKRADICDFTLEQWASLLQEYDNRCAYCGAPDAKLTQDHVVPLSKGGNHTQDNIVPACKPCNSRKHNSVGKFTPNIACA